MKDIKNSIFRNHELIYKVLLFLVTTVFIVYLFPKTGRFKYDFEKGKPWQSETLYAPFNFAIKKSDTEIDSETKRIKETSSSYFNIDTSIAKRVSEDYKTAFKVTFKDTLQSSIRDKIFDSGQNIIDRIYEFGLLDTDIVLKLTDNVVLLSGNQVLKKGEFSNVIQQSNLSKFISKELIKNDLIGFKSSFTSLFFDVLKPNLTFNKSFTEKAISEELANLSYTRGSIEKETLIISKGEIVGNNTLEVLESLKHEYETKVWNKSGYNWIVLAYIILVALALLMLLLFLRKYRLDIFNNNTKVTFIFFNVAFMVLLTTLVVRYNSKFIYIVPITILPLVLKAFFDSRLGLFTHVITVLLLGFIVPNSYEYMFLQIIAGIVTILTVSELYKRANLFISVGQITAVYIVAYFSFFVIHEGSIETLQPSVFGLFILCGLATLFVQPLIYIYEKVFGLVSDVSLLELSDTNSKLLKELANVAPGTFHHSLNVANLAEAVASEIGANIMLTRVGALYHDIGKMKNPTYFTENQTNGINSHEELQPKESASIIIDHVINGVEIAKKHNLPDRVIDFIRTHHGTSKVYYFYMQQKALDENVDETDFMYPGPKPYSKETAILMMCDSLEAASKSLKEPTSTKINKFVDTIINKQMEDNQFINANITFKEIELIKKVLKQKLANMYHLRIEYPE